jgi:hypothetical protein
VSGLPTVQELQSIAQYARNALDAIAQALAIGRDVTNMIAITGERLDAMSSAGRGPLAEEWDAQNAEIRALQQDLHTDDAATGGG